MKILLSLLIPSMFFLSGMDKKAYYSCLYQNDVSLINQQLKSLENSNFNEKDAFEGALLMKKAELVKEKKQKLDLFKSGKLKLEAAIAKQAKNIEFRFLRLIIQEHAPKFLSYDKNIQEDANFIITHLNLSPESLKKIIQEYSKTSLYLKL